MRPPTASLVRRVDVHGLRGAREVWYITNIYSRNSRFRFLFFLYFFLKTLLLTTNIVFFLFVKARARQRRGAWHRTARRSVIPVSVEKTLIRRRIPLGKLALKTTNQGLERSLCSFLHGQGLFKRSAFFTDTGMTRSHPPQQRPTSRQTKR